jgi:hypothetical protein
MFNFRHCQILDDTTFFYQIREDLKKDLLAIGIQGQLKNHPQVQNFSNDHAKFEFQDGLLYHDGLLYIVDGHVQLQVLQARHNALIANHFGFNKPWSSCFEIICGHNFGSM